MASLGFQVDSRYEQVVEFDHSGLTVLYRARHRVLGADHVLRVLWLDSENGLRSVFLERVRAQARLRHPAWVRVHNVFEERDCIIVASDAADGVSIEALMAAGAVDAVRAAVLVATLADALDELHQAGFVHHELRPAIVLVNPSLRSPRITQLSLRYQVEGEGASVAYASPEELVTPGSGDARADVHALGALLHHLVVGSPPFPIEGRAAALLRRLDGARPTPFGDPALAAIVAQCLTDRPADRLPSAGVLALRLRDWVASRTDVVEEEEELILDHSSVVDNRPSLNVTVSARPPTPFNTTRPGGVLARSGLGRLGLIAFVSLIVGYAAWRSWCREESVTLTDEALATLRHYKTDATANEDDAVLVNALTVATKAVEYDASPRALGVRALASAWQGGWHRANGSWDEGRFREANVLTEAATVGGQPEAWFARGLVLAGGCKLVNAEDPRRQTWCLDADAAYARALPALSGPGLGWLRFEVLWSQAVNANLSALSARRLGDSTAEQRGWAAAMVVCDQGYALLTDAPVNDRELAQECVAAAGGSGRYDKYFLWARALQADDRGDDGKLKNTNVETIYRAARPACANLHFERNRKKKALPETRGFAEAQFCYAAGLQALGCATAANVVIQANQWREAALPWTEIALGRGADSCYLDLP